MCRIPLEGSSQGVGSPAWASSRSASSAPQVIAEIWAHVSGQLATGKVRPSSAYAATALARASLTTKTVPL